MRLFGELILKTFCWYIIFEHAIAGQRVWFDTPTLYNSSIKPSQYIFAKYFVTRIFIIARQKCNLFCIDLATDDSIDVINKRCMLQTIYIGGNGYMKQRACDVGYSNYRTFDHNV